MLLMGGGEGFNSVTLRSSNLQAGAPGEGGRERGRGQISRNGPAAAGTSIHSGVTNSHPPTPLGQLVRDAVMIPGPRPTLNTLPAQGRAKVFSHSKPERSRGAAGELWSCMLRLFSSKVWEWRRVLGHRGAFWRHLECLSGRVACLPS